MVTNDDRTGRWVLDPERSTVTLAHKTMWGLVNVKGTLGGLSGEGVLGADGTLAGSLTIDPATISTKNKKRDEHLRSADFFDVGTHPSVTYTVTTGEFAPDGSLALHGTLQVIGVERPRDVQAQVADAGSSARLSTDLVINRDDFGMSWNKGGMLKGPATLHVEAHFTKAAG
jgi:polyisoprenoid-binding protein YceI